MSEEQKDVNSRALLTPHNQSHNMCARCTHCWRRCRKNKKERDDEKAAPFDLTILNKKAPACQSPETCSAERVPLALLRGAPITAFVMMATSESLRLACYQICRDDTYVHVQGKFKVFLSNNVVVIGLRHAALRQSGAHTTVLEAKSSMASVTLHFSKSETLVLHALSDIHPVRTWIPAPAAAPLRVPPARVTMNTVNTEASVDRTVSVASNIAFTSDITRAEQAFISVRPDGCGPHQASLGWDSTTDTYYISYKDSRGDYPLWIKGRMAGQLVVEPGGSPNAISAPSLDWNKLPELTSVGFHGAVVKQSTAEWSGEEVLWPDSF